MILTRGSARASLISSTLDGRPAVFRSLVARRGKTHAYLRVLYLSNFILRLAFGFVLLTLPFYVTPDPRFKFNTLLQVAVIAVPYPFAEMLTANWFGSISDKLGRKRVIVSGSTCPRCASASQAGRRCRWR